MTPTEALGSVLTAMITPMTQDFDLDHLGAATLAEDLVALGNDGLVINGTTGEASTTTDSEKAELVRTVVAAVGRRATVIAGVGTNDTRHSVELAVAASEAGADGLLVVTPYYSKPSQEGALAHFRAVADATELPVMLYDIPGRTGLALTVETLLRAAEHPRIVAVKDAKGDLLAATSVLRQTDLWWYSGDDGLNLPLLSLGAKGFVSVTGHLVADRLVTMLAAFRAGDNDLARDLFFGMDPVATGLFRAPAVSMAKVALELQGRPAGPPRMPLLPADDDQRAQLVLDLSAAGVRTAP
ncbi:MAG: 4-hydroxy-tetrahydrodipicolinate synthase [Actinomycetota bacterium]|nr:4-hydroxy-tetrahydrodipicolinate synthase [Actinomycetota bacterium]